MYKGGGVMAQQKEITCEVEFSEGAVNRITGAFVDLYHGIKNGLYKGPLPEDAKDTDDKTA